MRRKPRPRNSVPFAAAGLTVVLCLGGCNTSPHSDADGGLGQWLGFAPGPTAKQRVDQIAHTYSADQRRHEVLQLSASSRGDQSAYVELYRRLLNDPDATVRAAAVDALAAHGAVADAPRIAALLQDDAPFVRWSAAKALQRLHNPQTIGALLNAVKDDADTDVRMAAAAALGQYAQPSVFETLVGALIDNHYGVVQAASRSLSTLTGATLGDDPSVWLSWSDAHRGDWFAHQQRYVYHPYNKPAGVLDKMKFWNAHGPASRTPQGLETAAVCKHEAGA